MGLELKRRSKQYLKDIPNAIDLDGDGGNRVFGISDFPKYLGEGKNSFKINPLGRAIKPNTNIDIEVLDSNGRPIYWEIPTYKDGDNSRLISIWVYDVVDEKYHTPNGTCEIIIVAEGRSGPIRHTITTNVVKTKKSISEIVFSDTPNGSVSASIQTFTNLPQTDGTLTQVTQSGEFTYKKSIYGEDVSFEANTSIINGEMLSGSLELDLSSTTLFPILGGGQSQPTSITASISEVISSTLFRIPLPITASDNRSNGSIHTYEYSDDTISGLIRYQSTGSNTNTQNQVAIANISLTSVNPNSGRINSVNTLIKSEGLSNSDYELLSNTQVPNESDITYRVPIPTEHLNDPKSIKVQFLNSAGDVSSTEVIINNVIFEGGNVYIGGNQSIVTGSLFISNAIGSGLEIGGHSSGFLKSVGYEGQISASEGSGPGGFIIYSGSNALQMGADVLQGVGMQFVGDNDDRHLIFTTHDGGLLDVKTDKFFIGTQNTQFISGSDSNIEISSSLFHLDPKNDRLVIGADAIIEADLSANNIRTPATIGGVQSTDLNASSSIKSDGFARFVSASIGGWGIDTGSIFSDNLEINSSGKIKTRDYISDTKGWLIDETGIAEFANVKIRGTLATTTFEKESVNAVGGQLYVANSTTLSGSYSSSLDSTPATGVTSSASLPSQLGDTATDYLEFNSTNYLITSVDDTDKFTIDSAIYADGASATLHYSQSNSFSSQISASVVTSVTTTTNTPVSASVKNGIDLNGNETSFRLSNYSAITPSGYPTSNWFNKSVTISNRNNNSVFTVGGVETIGTITSVSPLEIELDSDTIDSAYAGIPIGGDTEDFYISFTSQSTTTTTTNVATENVIKKAGTWPTSIVNDGEITFNDGGGSRTYTILERVDSITLRVDTSSYAPNTSGSFVVATGAYSSSHSVGVTISAGTGSTTEYFYDNVSLSSSQFIVDNVSGFAVDEILTLKKVTNTGFSTEYVQVVSSSRLNGGSDTDLSGILNVTRAYGSGLTGDSSSLGDIASNSQSYDNGQVVVSTGKVGSGYIRLNANPNDTSTPYMDIVERTGSGLYDIELKARLGDLSGLSGNDLVHGRSNPGFGLATDNVYLQGGIIATFGEIGGFSIDTNTISSSNNNLILRDNGQITGSQVLLDGGTIGGFELGSDIISSSNGELVLKSNGEITGSNVLLDGGTIGGFEMGANIISSSNDDLVLKSNGQITGSQVLFDGGVIGGFKVGDTEISSSTGQLVLRSNGQITGSDVRVAVDVGSTTYDILDTSKGVIDAKNVGRSLYFNADEITISKSGTGSGATYATPIYITWQGLKYETQVNVSFQGMIHKSGTHRSIGGIKATLETATSGSETSGDSYYDTWSNLRTITNIGSIGSAGLSTAYIGSASRIGSDSYSFYIDNYTEGLDTYNHAQYQTQLFRLKLEPFVNVAFTGTGTSKVFVKNISLWTSRGLATTFEVATQAPDFGGFGGI